MKKKKLEENILNVYLEIPTWVSSNSLHAGKYAILDSSGIKKIVSYHGKSCYSVDLTVNKYVV